jgi:type III pantothenate kinase
LSNKHLLVIDIGNTNVVYGLFDGEQMIASWRIITKGRTADELGIQLLGFLELGSFSREMIGRSIISCVAPQHLSTFINMLQKYFAVTPLTVGPGVKTGMPILYDNPREVGADRIVNSVAAYEKYKQSLIVVDFGTATTFDCISEKGEYLGGAIAPGITTSLESLFRTASKLPRVELTKPKTVIGKTTIESMQAGIVFGYVGLVDELVKRIKLEMKTKPKVLATGGLASLIGRESKTIEEIDENLTMEGLKIIDYRNRGKSEVTT